ATLAGGLSMPGQFSANAGGVVSIQPFSASNSFDAAGLATLHGGLKLPEQFEVQSDAINTYLPLNAKNDFNLEKNLQVVGHTTLAGGLMLPDAFNIDAAGITTIKPLTAQSQVTFENTLVVKNAATLEGGLTLPEQFTADSTGITAYQPFTAKDTVKIDKTLTVSESAMLNGGFSVPDVLTADKERVNVNKPLHITQDKEQAPLKIHDPLRNCTPLLLTAAGKVGINTDTPNAQLHVVAPSGHDALRLEHRAADGSLSPALRITPQGQLALGRSTAEFKLDIAGNARISQELQLDGPLNISGMATLKGGLTLPGQLEANASGVLIHKPLEIKDNLLVSGSARFDNGLTLPGQFEASAAGVSANKLLSAKNGLIVEGNTTLSGELTLPGQLEAKASGLTLYKPLLVKESLEISKTLAVTGLSTLNGGLKLPNVLDAGSNGIVLDKELTAKALSKLQGGLSLTQGGAVHRISNNPCLDKDLASDDTLATQLAVKSYVDTYASPFGRGGNTYAIHTQAEFDAVFGNGSGTKVIPKYTTIMILPPRDNHHLHAYTHTDGTSIRPDHDEWKTIIGYELKNAVSLQSGVSILGFNAETTRIVKKHEDCRFLIEGTSSAAVKNIRMEGFTFDGGRLLYQGNGGAVYLNQAKDIVIDAVLIGHQVSGLGGALYGEINVSRVTARNIYACQARNTDTRLGKGGAAFGLRQSEIHASNCFANFGGAIAECHTSQAKASNCQAQLGGAAYQCQKLTLNARDCRAHWHGGGAYECAYLIANGHWEGNRSRYYNTQHIAAHTNSGGFMWRGDFIGNWVDTSWSYQNI
ncbi:MAG: hypothetical protein K2Q15_05010, partial [Burkholderiales bacterium]|nr:hypothetical protein [Burkholderiales bacterium]